MLNLGSAGVKDKDILRYVSACLSIYCEYLTGNTARIKSAAFYALRMII